MLHKMAMEYAVKIKIENTYYIEAASPELASEMAIEEAAMDMNDTWAEITVLDVDYA